MELSKSIHVIAQLLAAKMETIGKAIEEKVHELMATSDKPTQQIVGRFGGKIYVVQVK